MYYLDITLAVNGLMDAFLLGFTAYLLRRRIDPGRLLIAVIIGGIPVLFILYDFSDLTTVSRVLVPFIMVGVGLRTRSLVDLAKGVICFSLLAAACGGSFYFFAGWLGLSDKITPFLTLAKFLFLPFIIILLIGGCRIWEKINRTNLFLDNILYEAEIFFEDKSLKIKALLDTGNDLRDPISDRPVMLLEEKAALPVLPPDILNFLSLSWRDSTSDPWPFLWNAEHYYLPRITFISAKGINGQSWLPGIRSVKVQISQSGSSWEQLVTVALVNRKLSSEEKFQALLHPEQIKIRKEEIA